MATQARHLEFAPPPAPGFLRAFGLALLAHAVLVTALTYGVSWKSQTIESVAEAELWAQMPVQAAPKLEEAVPAPPPPLPPQPEPAARAPEPAKAEVPDIVTQREKQRLADEKRLEDDKRAQDKAGKKRLAEQEKALQLEARQKLEAQKLADAKKEKLLKDAQLAKEVAQQEARRLENIQRATGLAGAAGAPTATGTALQSAGPSASYGGRIRARIKPNIVFTEDIAGNPTAEVEVRTSPDGTIVGKTLLKRSGSPAWDEAVLKAIDKTEALPRDVDGRVPSPLVISFRPKD